MLEPKTWPRLYGEASKGNTKEWEISVVPAGVECDRCGVALYADDQEDLMICGKCGVGFNRDELKKTWPAIIKVEFGGTGAKMQNTTKIIKEGKNLGKANETTPFQQACNEAQSDYDKKLKKGYRLSVAELKGLMDQTTMLDQGASAAKIATGDPTLDSILEGGIPPGAITNVSGKPILPMKAQTFSKRKHDIKWPAFAQAKIDGHRAYGTGGKMLSSGGDPVPGYPHMPLIQKEIEVLCGLLPDGMWYDGELYSTEMPFGRLSSCIRGATLKEKNVPLIPYVKFFIFDVFDPNNLHLTNEERVKIIDTAIISYPFQHIVPVPVNIVHTEQELMAFHDECVQAGFEGVIIRNLLAQYRIGYRAKDIQKHKDFLDAEFEIVGYKEVMDHGYDKDKNPIELPTVVWMCKTREGNQFEVRPIGSMEWRHGLLVHGDEHVGKQLIVRYQNMSEYNVPRFPVGKDFRDIGS